jgi:hypothetical protein
MSGNQDAERARADAGAERTKKALKLAYDRAEGDYDKFSLLHRTSLFGPPH